MNLLKIFKKQKNDQTFVDQRDKVQKKTFTKWVNKHLLKVSHLLLMRDFGMFLQ